MGGGRCALDLCKLVHAGLRRLVGARAFGQFDLAGVDTGRTSSLHRSAEDGLRPRDGEPAVGRGHGPAAIVVIHLVADLHGRGLGGLHAVENQKDIGLEVEKRALHQRHIQVHQLVGIGGITRHLHPSRAGAEVGHAGIRPGSIGALTAIVVLVALAVDEHGRMRLGETQPPARHGSDIGAAKGVMEQPFAVNFE